MVEFRWKEERVDGEFDVVAFSRPKSGPIWALGHSRRMFSTVTGTLHRQAGVWQCAFEVRGRLDSIGVLADGSILAVGESLSVFFDGERWSKIGSGLKDSRRIWGSHPGCANALSLEGLFYLDASRWKYVGLEADGIDGRFVDGDCDAGGTGWIVGTYGSHSCVATGSGLKWQRFGCSSWYLNQVYVAEESRAFAAGGDGVWRYDGTRWSMVGSDRKVGPLPLALSAAGPDPIVIACTLGELVRGEQHSASAESPFRAELMVLNTTGWHDLRGPIVLAAPSAMRLAVDTNARLLMAGGRSIWESPQLTSP